MEYLWLIVSPIMIPMALPCLLRAVSSDNERWVVETGGEGSAAASTFTLVPARSGSSDGRHGHVPLPVVTVHRSEWRLVLLLSLAPKNHHVCPGFLTLRRELHPKL